jgi:hypothetical protein
MPDALPFAVVEWRSSGESFQRWDETSEPKPPLCNQLGLVDRAAFDFGARRDVDESLQHLVEWRHPSGAPVHEQCALLAIVAKNQSACAGRTWQFGVAPEGSHNSDESRWLI